MTEHSTPWIDSHYRLVLDAAPDAILVVNRVGDIVVANLQAATLFGYDPRELHGRKVESIVPLGQRKRQAEHRGSFLRDRHVQLMSTRLDLFAVRSDGSNIPVDIGLSPVTINSETYTIMTVRDATEHRRAEDLQRSQALLREGEERFRAIADTAPVLIWASNQGGLRTYFNKRWLEFTGEPLETQVADGWTKGVHPDDLDNCLRTYMAAIDRRQSFRMEYQLKRNDGEFRYVLDTGVPRIDSPNVFVGYIGSCIDVTDHRLAEEALANVSRKLIEAHEQERTRIARDLHDDTTQRLALMAVHLEGVKKDLWNPSARLVKRVDEIRKQAVELSTDLQTMSHELYSPKLDYLSISAAIKSFCQEFGDQYKVKIKFTRHNVPNHVPEEVAICLFRIVQECLHNAAKHSQARDFDVELRGVAGEIRLVVRDSGIGFNFEDTMTSRGLGLVSMRERTSLLGGSLWIKSRLHQGTEITARIPLPVVRSTPVPIDAPKNKRGMREDPRFRLGMTS
jgi:PAS domain S-box-containing protein